jgi:L-ascorbate metabolism protein UlaG (beta-lactamase superfamily)
MHDSMENAHFTNVAWRAVNSNTEPEQIPDLDAVLVTHIDNDHFSRVTCRKLKAVCRSYHAPQYVAEVMREEGLNGIGHDIHETFSVGNASVTLTLAEHNWQNEHSKYNYREWALEDYCGFWIDTPDGSIWMPGDSRLLEEQLHMPKQPDVLLLDFADNSWHITFEGAVKLANTYPNAQIICIHWGQWMHLIGIHLMEILPCLQITC